MSGIESNVNNYLPIFHLPIFSKIFERVVFNQLYSFFLEKFKLLNRNQYGFMKCESTSQASMDNLEYMYKNLESRNIITSLS